MALSLSVSQQRYHLLAFAVSQISVLYLSAWVKYKVGVKFSDDSTVKDKSFLQVAAVSLQSAAAATFEGDTSTCTLTVRVKHAKSKLKDFIISNFVYL